MDNFDSIIPLNNGRWKLALVPKSLRPKILLIAAAYLAQCGSLLVLDGGNQFNAYYVARLVRGRPEILSRIRVSRAFTCYQMSSMLEDVNISGETIFLLDFLSTFYDESAPFLDRSRLLNLCITHIQRLSLVNRLLVAVHPPAISSPQATQLIKYLANEASEVFTTEAIPTSPEPLRLF